MDDERGFLVEEFIDSLTSQLDRVQDALRVKAVNRPLTYALKELSLDLKVNVAMDDNGQVRFRTSAPGEEGTSTVHLDFTTITKPMIEENTVTLATTRSPSLSEAGLKPQEQQKLERMGVRNVAQLKQLRQSAGERGLSRLVNLPVGRLRQALTQSKPTVGKIVPVQEPKPQKPESRPQRPHLSPKDTRPKPRPKHPIPQRPIRPKPKRPRRPPARPRGPIMVQPVKPGLPNIRIPRGTRRLKLAGANFWDETLPEITLDATPLNVAHIDEDEMMVDLPEDIHEGTLSITTADGDVTTYALTAEDSDPWEPEEDTP